MVEQYSVMSTAINKPANEPYGYKIIHQPFDSEPRYFSGAEYKFHFYSGTDDLPGDREFEVVREAIREWNNIRGFSFRIQEESKPWLDLPVNCGRDYHSHISWRYPWPLPDQCFAWNHGTAAAVTHLWPKIFGRKIDEADIAFNDDDTVIRWNEFNLRIVAMHELGHVISLDDLYNISNHDEDKKQIMHDLKYGYRIEWGDRAGARWMYSAIYYIM